MVRVLPTVLPDIHMRHFGSLQTSDFKFTTRPASTQYTVDYCSYAWAGMVPSGVVETHSQHSLDVSKALVRNPYEDSTITPNQDSSVHSPFFGRRD